MTSFGPAGPEGSARAHTNEVMFGHDTPAGKTFDVLRTRQPRGGGGVLLALLGAARATEDALVNRARLRSLCTMATVLLWGCTLSGAPGTGGRPCPSTRGQQIVSLLNITRARENLPELRVDVRLMRAAQAHAEDMAAGAFSGHDGSDGSLPADRADRTDYPWIFVAENTSAGYSTAPSAFAAWMDSPSHRANNLHLEAEHVGVGYAENGDTQYRAYWVTLFGASSEPPRTTPGGCHP